MDLERLKIDRSAARGRTRRGAVWARPAVLTAVAALAWLFWKPVRRAIDTVRLPEVETARVVRPSASAVGAVAGAAANGHVVARTRAALSADAPGRIVEMNVEEGMVVPAGFVVARLYHAELEAAARRAEAEVVRGEAAVQRALAGVASAEADEQRARADLAAAEARHAETRARSGLAEVTVGRTQRLVAEDVVDVQALDDARAERDAARALVRAAAAGVVASRAAADAAGTRRREAVAALEESRAAVRSLAAGRDLAEASLDKTFIRAPFDGVVVLKDAEVGEVVSPNSQGGNSRGSVATMVDFASLEVQADVPETSLKAVRPGARARIYLDADPGHPYEGRVERIWPTANRQKASVEVRVSFLERDERLRPEMGVRVVFLEEDADAPTTAAAEPRILVPESAVISTAEGTSVFVVERDRVRLRRVLVDEPAAGRRAVTEGLRAGELIVTSPPPELEDGDRVRLGD